MLPEAVSSTRDSSRHVVTLAGCRATPLASYLKALGILRLVAEQKDSTALGWWEDGVFRLDSRLDCDQLTGFFLKEYSPTPIVGPWGARSGFFPGGSEASARMALQRISADDSDRLRSFRDTVATVRELLREMGVAKKADMDKEMMLQACRAALADDVIPWLDACYVLTEDGARFPPLLGTGGNEGSGSYTSGFAQMIVECVIERKHDHALGATLFDRATARWFVDQTPGQFDPGAAGGVSGMGAWDYLMLLEGTLPFSAAATRRSRAESSGPAVFPFTVSSTGAGSGAVATVDEANRRGEMWCPIWTHPASYAEVRFLFTEGRASVQGRGGSARVATDGLDFVRAATGLGIDRGIVAFERHSYLQRLGRNTIAVPLGRVPVRRTPISDLIIELESDGWLRRFRRVARGDHAPAHLRTVLRRLEDSLFDLAQSAGSPAQVQRCLTILGECQRYLSRSPATRETCPPVPSLGEKWVTRANDGSPGFLIAAGLASLRGRMVGGDVKRGESTSRVVLTTAEYMAPIRDGRSRSWSDGSSHRVVWGSGRLDRNLGRMMVRRMLDQNELGLGELPLQSVFKTDAAISSEWLLHPEWDRRIGELVEGLALVRMFPVHQQAEAVISQPIPVAFALLKPFFVPIDQLARVLSARPSDTDTGPLSQPAEIVRLLRADQRDRALATAVRDLRTRGFAAPRVVPGTRLGSGPRLLAGLMVPITDRSLGKLLRSILGDDPAQSMSVTSIHEEI